MDNFYDNINPSSFSGNLDSWNSTAAIDSVQQYDSSISYVDFSVSKIIKDRINKKRKIQYINLFCRSW